MRHLKRLDPLKLVWVAIALTAVLSGCSGESDQPIDSVKINVVGNDYLFRFQYPGQDQKIDTDDDRYGAKNLYVPENAVVLVRLDSHDFVYTLEIPELDLYEAVIPDFSFEKKFVAKSVGSHDLLGTQMCGYDHPDLIGKLIVQAPAEFRRTMKRLEKSPAKTK